MDPYECIYYSGRCDHPECESGAYLNYIGERYEQQPTEEDYCASTNHSFYSYQDEDEKGRCWCGKQEYAMCERCELAYQLNLLWDDGCYCKECYSALFCEVELYSSRACEIGTKGCVVKHYGGK